MKKYVTSAVRQNPPSPSLRSLPSELPGTFAKAGGRAQFLWSEHAPDLPCEKAATASQHQLKMGLSA